MKVACACAPVLVYKRAMSTIKATSLLSPPPPPPPQSQPKRVDIDVQKTGTIKIIFAAAASACRIQYLCDKPYRGSLLGASSRSAITTHASGYGCADDRNNNQSCIRRSRNSQPKLCAEFNAVAGTCNEHGHGSILDAEALPPQSQPTRVDMDVWQAGTTKVVFAAAETARLIHYLCDDHDHDSIIDAPSPSATTTHASGHSCVEGRNNPKLYSPQPKLRAEYSTCAISTTMIASLAPCLPP